MMKVARNVIRSGLFLAIVCAFAHPALAQPAAVAGNEGSEEVRAEGASEERFNAWFQATWIESRHGNYSAAYSNLNGSTNSLSRLAERSWTFSASAFLGVRLWEGGEAYLVPDLISELPFSDLKGLGGAIQNGELEKSGMAQPTLYHSRAFIRQTWNLGGSIDRVDSGPMQLAGGVDSRRIVLSAGNMAVIDVFDKNSYAGDTRTQFLNMGFLTHAAYDFAADARGYSDGIALEYYDGPWALRGGRFLTPRQPNQLRLNDQIGQFYGDQLELEHRHMVREWPGKVKLLAYRNHEQMGRFDDAMAAYNANPSVYNAANCQSFSYGSNNASAPDMCWVRTKHIKMGAGVNFEQSLPGDIGVFARALASDGQTEVFSFTSADRSASFGGVMRGTAWGRAQDAVGIGYQMSFLSGSHAAYLRSGGIDGFVGDGALKYSPETVAEIYYSWGVTRNMWLTADFQHIANPGYNADRGPVDVYNMRVHVEF